MTRGGARFVAAAAAVVMLALSMTFLPPARVAEDGGRFSILAMGDSYTAGNSADDYYDQKTSCSRSANNYARHLQRRIERDDGHPPVFVHTEACSGAVTKDFFNARGKNNGIRPQIDAVDTGYDLILLTIGGNDIYFGEIVEHCFIGWRRTYDHCKDNLDRAEGLLKGGSAEGSVETNITKVLTEIGKRADIRARIVLLGYPYLERNEDFKLEKSTCVKRGPRGSCAQSRKDALPVGAHVRALGTTGDDVQQRAVDRANDATQGRGPRFQFVNVKKTFENHDISAGGGNAASWFAFPSGRETGRIGTTRFFRAMKPRATCSTTHRVFHTKTSTAACPAGAKRPAPAGDQ